MQRDFCVVSTDRAIATFDSVTHVSESIGFALGWDC